MRKYFGKTYLCECAEYPRFKDIMKPRDVSQAENNADAAERATVSVQGGMVPRGPGETAGALPASGEMGLGTNTGNLRMLPPPTPPRARTHTYTHTLCLASARSGWT